MVGSQDLKRRLHSLGNRVFYLSCYTFSDIYGFDDETISNLAKDIEKDLKAVITGLPCYHIDRTKLSLVDVSLLEAWEKKIKQATNLIQSDEIYQQLLRAYNSNDQDDIARLMSSVFLPKLLKKEKILYHGVTPRKITIGEEGIDFEEEHPPVREYRTPDEYIDLVVLIQEEGLLPSKGMHSSMDENIRPVFAVSDPEDTYGLLFFELNPMKYGYNIFHAGECDGDEHLIYTPQLRMPMKLCLKSTEYVESGRINGVLTSSDCSELKFYRNQLEDRLRQRLVDFQIVEPRHIERL